jgi:hypothetical protein
MTYSNCVARAAEWFEDFRARKLVESCTYVQRGVVFEDVHLTPALENAETNDDTGVIFNTTRRDFLASPTEFAEKGIANPQRGDRVVRRIEGVDHEFEVVSTIGEPPVRYMTRYQKTWRIHAQLVRTEVPTELRQFGAGT